ncbi:dipeptide ABC transporter ATP-binding protein [Bacillus lacus]|uniref:Dipeptide ABC transporter ATP-binding protein n=1 Tax=Metabacillus lacus TaxID=1983721 RepID=A0A7X2LYN4_9BACI|nr:dipeptide ABC transporter ATP-binding protein [Metabacillus lacus]MRX73760.1 dipeptide ABC transporter ATP-binding protein [Metabacillus lacus]
MTSSLLKVNGLKKHFPVSSGILNRNAGAVKAVDDLSFEIRKGETLGIVGESGCGKSTMGRLLLRLIEPTEGEIYFNGTNVAGQKKSELRAMRKEMQMVFQDPYASLNPRMTVAKILEEPLIVHKIGTKQERAKLVEQMLTTVGLDPDYGERYPHQFSGGQRQRIGIARALMTNPQLIIADEPVSALDVSIQSQILNLLKDLQKEFSLTYLFISHDLGVVRHISDRVGVMYLGRIVELADSESLYTDPKHPYTQALLSAVPLPDPNVRKEQIVLKGDLPSPADPPKGCAFHTRCAHCFDTCKTVRPQLKEIKEGHYAACHLYE